jgi:hypothetical protein
LKPEVQLLSSSTNSTLSDLSDTEKVCLRVASRPSKLSSLDTQLELRRAQIKSQEFLYYVCPLSSTEDERRFVNALVRLARRLRIQFLESWQERSCCENIGNDLPRMVLDHHEVVWISRKSTEGDCNNLSIRAQVNSRRIWGGLRTGVVDST